MSQTQTNSINHKMPRRGFLKMAIAGLNGLIALALAIPGVGYLLTPVFRKGSQTWINLGNLNNFPSGEPRKAVFGYMTQLDYTRTEKKRFVWVRLHTGNSQELTVLSAECTHTGCNVAWHPDVDKFICPCHQGTYDINGNVIAGPPPRPLKELPVRIENNQVLVRIEA